MSSTFNHKKNPVHPWVHVEAFAKHLRRPIKASLRYCVPGSGTDTTKKHEACFRLPDPETDIDIQIYYGPYKQITLLQYGPPAQLKGWILGRNQIQSVTNTSSNDVPPADSGRWSEDVRLCWMNAILSSASLLIIRCLWHFENWPLRDARWGSPLETAAGNSERQGKPQAESCDVGWSHHRLRSFVSLCRSHVINTEPTTQTLASFMGTARLVNCDERSINFSRWRQCLCRKSSAETRILSIHSDVSHTETHTGAHPRAPSSHTYNILPGFESICGSAQSPLHKFFVTNERAWGLLLWWWSERTQLCQLENSTDFL